MKLRALGLLAFLLISSPAFADEAPVIAKCTPVKEYLGKPVQAFLAAHVKRKLESLGIKEVVVTIKGLKYGAADADKTFTRGDFLESVNLGGAGTAANPYTLYGSVSDSLDGVGTSCNVKLAKATVKWSGKFSFTDPATGKTTVTNYKRKLITATGLSLPGIYIPK